MSEAATHARKARVRETWAVALVVGGVLPGLAAPSLRLAWVGVVAALACAAVSIALVVLGRHRRARTTMGLTFVALLFAQVAHSPLVLTDISALLGKAVLLVLVPGIALVGAYVLTDAAAEERRKAWGRDYQEKVGYDPRRADPTMDWR